MDKFSIVKVLGQIFLLADLRVFFRFRVGGRKKRSENDQLAGHFQSFSLISPEQGLQ